MYLRNFHLLLFSSLLLAGCAKQTVMPLASDTFKIDSATEGMCGFSSAQNIALQRAAIETINRGYDKFIITHTGSGGSGEWVREAIVVRVISDKDKEASRALSARSILGPDWQNSVAQGSTKLTCL